MRLGNAVFPCEFPPNREISGESGVRQTRTTAKFKRLREQL
jgi:hypothetical protein